MREAPRPPPTPPSSARAYPWNPARRPGRLVPSARITRVSDPSSTSALDDAPTDQREVNDLEPYEAVVLVSFGGPDRGGGVVGVSVGGRGRRGEVVPCLKNVPRGRAIPRERLAEVGEHYF